MKRIIFIAFILLSTSVLYAQKDNDFYKHEVKLSIGDAALYNASNYWNYINEKFYFNTSIAYLYSPVKGIWVGANFINYFGNRTYYNWREYDTNGKFNDFSKSKMQYGVAIAPEIRLSCINKKTIVYGAISRGLGWVNSYDNYNYWEKIPYLHITLLGISGNFGRNDNIFLGGELGVGYKGIFNFHGGYRF
jgi:hypothetical protein